MSSTRVFVRLFDGGVGRETDDEVVALPPAPLTWKAVIAAMAAAVGRAEPADGTRVRLFLLPSEADGIAAELNARALRFGVRENDRFVLCLNGEDYQQPAASAAATGSLPEPEKQPSPKMEALPVASSAPPSGSIASAAPPAGAMGFSSGKKGNKRYRSISGKMAAIKSLGDKGLISAEDRGHLKDLLLNNDSPQLQEALDRYNSTGDFQAVKDLLVKEMQNPSSKRNTSDWLSESLVNDIELSFNTNVTPTASASNGKGFSSVGTSNVNAMSMPMPTSTPFSYPMSSQQQSVSSQLVQDTSTYLQSSTASANISYSMSMPTAPTVTPATGTHLSPTVARPPMLTTPRAFTPAPAPPTVMPDPFNHPQMSPTNVYASSAPQINMPLRDRNGFMKRAYEASPVNAMNGMMAPMNSPPAVSNMGYGMPQQQQQQYAMTQGFPGMAPGYPAASMTPNGYPRMGGAGMPMYGMTTGGFNPYQQQGYQVMSNGYPYGSLMADGSAVPGYDFYSAGYGYGKAQIRVGGKWTTAPPMPSYPPPCSKEEKKEKIARWLKKRENRNWSNKPSYPVRHSIAKNRKRGEDGRFITKARLAEMEAEEAAAAAAAAAGGTPGDVLDNQVQPMMPAQSSMPQPTPVV